MDGYDRALLLTYLQQVPAFGACSERELELIADLADVTGVAHGTELVREGDVGNDFFLVVQGEVVVERGGHEVAHIGPGGFFGELALFDEAPRNATVVAGSSAAVAAFTRDAFRAALDELPALRDSLLRGMARRLHELDARA